MDQNYYDDSSAPDPEEKMEKDDTKTALIPSSLCPGMDVGDEVALKIVAVHEDEYEVSYSHSEADEESEGKEQPSMSRAQAQNQDSSNYLD